jgi:hypothetical protein
MKPIMNIFKSILFAFFAVTTYAQTATISGILQLPPNVSIDTNLYIVNVEQVGTGLTFSKKLRNNQVAPNNPIYTYDFDLPINQNYKISISTTDTKDVLNGVSTLDMVMIQRHILGIAPFTETVRLIQADANANGVVTVSDIVELRALILGINTTFSSGRNIFVVTQEAQPKFNYTVSNLNANVTGLDFYRIKIGDVNGSAIGF